MASSYVEQGNGVLMVPLSSGQEYCSKPSIRAMIPAASTNDISTSSCNVQKTLFHLFIFFNETCYGVDVIYLFLFWLRFPSRLILAERVGDGEKQIIPSRHSLSFKLNSHMYNSQSCPFVSHYLCEFRLPVRFGAFVSVAPCQLKVPEITAHTHRHLNQTLNQRLLFT